MVKYTKQVTVHKIPSSGKYKVQGHVKAVYPDGHTNYPQQYSKTFNLKKDADADAKAIRKAYATWIKKSA